MNLSALPKELLIKIIVNVQKDKDEELLQNLRNHPLNVEKCVTCGMFYSIFHEFKRSKLSSYKVYFCNRCYIELTDKDCNYFYVDNSLPKTLFKEDAK